MLRTSWTPNPYSIALRLSGQMDEASLLKSDGRRADDFLAEVFHLGGGQTMAKALEMFREIASNAAKPLSLNQAMDLQGVRSSKFSRDEIRRVIPLLASLADSELDPVDPATISSPDSVEPLGAGQQLVIGEPNYLKPIQGDAADCYLISALIATAWTLPAALKRALNQPGFDSRARSERSFTWQFHDQEDDQRAHIKVSAQILVRRTGIPIYARSGIAEECWPSLIEKAYVVLDQQLTADPTEDNYRLTGFGLTPQAACRALFGGTDHGEVLDQDSDRAMFLPTNGRGRIGADDLATPRPKLIDANGVAICPIMAWTKGVPKDPEMWENSRLFSAHAYAVLGVMPSGHVVLRNPLGIATDRRPGYSDENGWDPAGREPVRLDAAGVFALSQDVFFKNFGNLGWLDHELVGP